MRFLNTKIPPPIIAIFCAIMMWMLRDFGPSINLSDNFKLSILFICIGIAIAFDLSALREFGRAKTTINPLNPQKAQSIVTSGIYKITRNPMYVGIVVLLFGFCMKFGSYIGFIFIPLFITYITIFQIIPEEIALEAKFRDEYLKYKNKVRRWI